MFRRDSSQICCGEASNTNIAVKKIVTAASVKSFLAKMKQFEQTVNKIVVVGVKRYEIHPVLC